MNTQGVSINKTELQNHVFCPLPPFDSHCFIKFIQEQGMYR